MGKIATELKARGEDVLLLSWRENPQRLADLIKHWGGGDLIICGYSYGGATCTMLCRELCRLGIEVQELVLADAVYRVWQRLASWRSLLDHWVLTIPPNVARVTSWRQKVSKPSGHLVVVDHKTTSLHSRTLLVPHTQVDRHPDIREHILSIQEKA